VPSGGELNRRRVDEDDEEERGQRNDGKTNTDMTTKGEK